MSWPWPPAMPVMRIFSPGRAPPRGDPAPESTPAAAGGAAPRRVYRAARHVAGRGYAGAAAVAQAVVERPDGDRPAPWGSGRAPHRVVRSPRSGSRGRVPGSGHPLRIGVTEEDQRVEHRLPVVGTRVALDGSGSPAEGRLGVLPAS